MLCISNSIQNGETAFGNVLANIVGESRYTDRGGMHRDTVHKRSSSTIKGSYGGGLFVCDRSKRKDR